MGWKPQWGDGGNVAGWTFEPGYEAPWDTAKSFADIADAYKPQALERITRNYWGSDAEQIIQQIEAAGIPREDALEKLYKEYRTNPDFANGGLTPAEIKQFAGVKETPESIAQNREWVKNDQAMKSKDDDSALGALLKSGFAKVASLPLAVGGIQSGLSRLAGSGAGESLGLAGNAADASWGVNARGAGELISTQAQNLFPGSAASKAASAASAAKVFGAGGMSLGIMASLAGAGAGVLGAASALGGGKLGTTTTQQANIPGKTANELEAERLILEQLSRDAELQKSLTPLQQREIALRLEILNGEQARQAKLDASFTPEQEAEYNKQERERNTRIAAAGEELQNIQLQNLRQGTKATPEQLAAINESTAAAQRIGEADIERFRTATLRQINEEIAAASGLRPTDTPIVRLSERAGEEATRQQGILTSRMAETNATARLNYPLATQQLQANIAGTQQGLAQSAAEFQAQLNQRAADNRMRLFQPGLSAAPASNAGTSFASSLANQRIGGATTTSTQSGLGLAGIGQLAGGVGGLMSGMRLFGAGV